MASIRAVLEKLSPRGRLALAGAGVALLVLVFLMFQMATRKSYSTLASEVDPAETGKIARALEEKGISYEVRDGGTAVAVADSEISQARIALAEANVLGGAKPGFELFDEQKFGASAFEQKVTYQRALEGELERTISQVDGVGSATVRLTMPEDQLFAAESAKPTAAVLLGSEGGRLGPASVRGIARLVASSVEGLNFRDVTVTDSSGATLWPAGAGAGAGAVSKQAVEARYEQALQAHLDALLVRTIGPDKGRVQVQADLDANHTTQSRLEYADRGTPIDRSTERESLDGAGSGLAGGPAGTAANIPTYGAAAGAAAGGSKYKRSSEEARFGVDKTVTRTRVAPGSVNRQHVALVVDRSVPQAEVAQLQKAIATAAGIEPKRGDTIRTSRVAFAEPPPVSPPGATGILDLLPKALLALAALGFLAFAGRHLRRRQDEVLDPEPVWLRELNAPTSLAELSLAEDGERDWGEQETAVGQETDEVASLEPDRVAQQLRAWIKEG